MGYTMEELLPVVAELARKYSGHESTSVTYEKAQSLMEGVLYCLDEYQRSGGENLVYREIPVLEQYKAGARLVREKAEDVRKIFNGLSDYFEDYGVVCLCDTVRKGIPEFLKWYDPVFSPQETIITLDYPLLIDVRPFTGVDAVYAYLCTIRTEQHFLRKFQKGYVTEVLDRYSSDYKDMIENVCGIILANMIGHAAIGKPMGRPGFTEEDYLQLSRLFASKSKEETERFLRDVIKKMAEQFCKGDESIPAYLCEDVKNLAVRIGVAVEAGRLDKIFLL